jgi:hypothetical protein
MVSLKIKVICKICDFHSDDYEECCLLGCGAVYILCELTFLRNVPEDNILQKQYASHKNLVQPYQIIICVIPDTKNKT